MPNRSGRAVPVADYAPQGLLPNGLLPVARPDGATEAALAADAGKLAGTFGTIADEAAVAEGTAAGKVGGLDPSYRPSDIPTLRAKAFDKAATTTALNRIDADVRTDMQSIFEANRNDPVKLKQGFDTLHAEYLSKHVFPEIEGDFNSQFARLRMPFQNKALANFDEGVRDQSRASLVDNITATQTNAARMAAADPNNPLTGKSIGIELDRTDRLIDEQIASEAITAEAGAKLKIKTRNDVLQTAALAQASELKTPEEIATYRENVKTKFAKGEFRGLTGDGYQTLDASLQQLQNAKRTEINTGVAQMSKNIDDYVDRAASGLPTPPDEWTKYATSDAAKTPKGAAVLQVGETKVHIATVMSKMSIDDAGRMVAGMRTEAAKGGATAPDGAVIAFAEEQLTKQRTALNTDQLGFAASKRLIPAVAPLDFQGFTASNDPAAAGVLAAQFRDRTAQAQAVGAEMSRSPQFLRPDEKARLAEVVDQGGDKALALAGAIVKGAGPDAGNVLKEISNDAPLLAQSGLIIANGGSMSAARDAMEFNRLKANKLDPVTAAPTISGPASRDIIGTAYSRVPEAAGNVRVMANAIAGARITRAGVDPKGSEADTIYKRALQEAAGASFVGDVQYGGLSSYSTGFWGTKAQTVVPPGLRADAFRDVIRSITDADLQGLAVPPQTSDGKPYTAREISRAFPVATAGGYRLALGNPASDKPLFVRGADGKPFTLSFDDVIKIAPRVPGALLGGQ